MIQSRTDRPCLDEYFPEAVRLLRWEGTLIGPLRIAGRRIAAVAALDDAVHQHRKATGWAPMVDRTEVSAHLELPQLGKMPEPAVTLVGALGTVLHLSYALHNVFPFSLMCPAAVVMRRTGSGCVPGRGLVLGRLGIVMVDDRGSVDVVREPISPPRYPPNYEVYRRWVLEVMYERALTAQQGR